MRNESLRSQGDMIWKSIQYFFLLISALISAHLIALGTILDLDDLQIQFCLLVVSLIFPVLVAGFSLVGTEVVRRRFSRILEFVAHISKVESLLGLDEDISERLRQLNVFAKDMYLFQRFVNGKAKYETEKEFINGELNDPIEGRNLYTDMRKVFWGFTGLGVFLILVNMLLIIYVLCRLVN